MMRIRTTSFGQRFDYLLSIPLLFYLLLILALVLSVLFSITPESVRTAFSETAVMYAIILSVATSLISTVLSIFVAVPAGYILSVQGRSQLDCIYLVKNGAMELYFSTNGKEEHTGVLDPGDVFGGISILMNAGISIRSVRVVADVKLYILPRSEFLDICTRFPAFYESFATKFRSRMNDETYASIVSAGQALHFISRLVPFSFLPAKELDKIAAATSVINYPAGTKLF